MDGSMMRMISLGVESKALMVLMTQRPVDEQGWIWDDGKCVSGLLIEYDTRYDCGGKADRSITKINRGR